VNKDVMQQHLELISAATETGRHAVVIMDGAGYANITRQIVALTHMRIS